MKIYVASSWCNTRQPVVVALLRDLGHEVYDFRNPPGGTGFRWSECATSEPPWSGRYYRNVLDTDRAKAGYESDKSAILWCDELLQVEPCGKSASWELGFAFGLGKRTAVLLEAWVKEPELMPRESKLIVNWAELIEHYGYAHR